MTVSNLLMNASEPVRPLRADCFRLRRRDFRVGRALEILAHAIEYLSDESYYHGCSVLDRRAELDAIEMLMARNREIYLSYRVISTFGERFRKFMRSALGNSGMNAGGAILGKS